MITFIYNQCVKWKGISIFFVITNALWLASCSVISEGQEFQDKEYLAKIQYAKQGVSSNDEWEPFIREIDGFEMAMIPAGCFLMGSEAKADEMPIHEVCLSSPFWLDVTEISNKAFEQYEGFAAEESYVNKPEHPRENLTYAEAVAFCELREGRLPTEAEWEYAGRGPDALDFPWGNEFDPTKLNYCDMNCTAFGPANRDADADDGYPESAPVGSIPSDISWVGALDLAGNVHEMVSDWYAADYYAQSPHEDPTGPESGRQRPVRGGCWGCNADGARLSIRHRSLSPPTEEFRSIVTGFRCVIPIKPTN